MNVFLTLAFLFFIGSVLGWVIEVLFRRFISTSNPERKWINPGFCTGPYLPIYGCGLCTMYLIAGFENYEFIEEPVLKKAVLFLVMAVFMTAIEYIAGIFCLKVMKVRLWDYSNERGNIQGVICPKFSLFWAILGAVYYFLVHPYIKDALAWLSNNLEFSFVIGLFFGIFITDAVRSANLIAKLKKYAEENNVIVRYESIKMSIRQHYDRTKQKYNFFRPFKTEIPLSEHLHRLKESFEEIKNKIYK
ncbi:MAG: putative ABC transporter permease [Eubacterium sp.]|nr:putative ABC transporter permease [Eubacterium sp.]